MKVGEMRCEEVKWTELAQDRVEWRIYDDCDEHSGFGSS